MPALSGGMILYSSRSAKSVACSRLNVIGVSAFFFFPVFVAALTRADEFHSVMKTRWPSAVSHFASSPSCVVFPDPSIPSTTTNLPGYSCGCISVLSMSVFRLGREPSRFDAERLAGHPLEGRGVALRRPELQLRVARRSDLQQIVVAAVMELDRGHTLRMAAIEALGEPQDGRERSHGAPFLALQIAESLVAALRRRLAMVARHERHDFDFVRLEAAEVAVADQIVRVPVMAFVTDVDADVVKDGGILEPFALAIGQPVNDAGLIEQRRGKACDLMGVGRPVVAALGQLDDAAPADVGIAIRVGDLLPVARHVIEHEPFAQRQVAERQIVGAEPPQNLVDEDRAGHDQVGPSRLEAGHAQALFEAQRGEVLAQTVQLLRGDAPVAQRHAELALFSERDGAQAQDRARRADDPREAVARDLAEVLADLIVDEADELSLVARFERVALDEALRQPDDAEFETAAQFDARAVAPRYLDAAAADVDDDRDVARIPDAVDRRGMDQPRFLGARNHLRADAGLIGHGPQEIPAVFRLAGGARGHGHDVFDAMRFGQTPEFCEHLECRVHGLRREGAAV